MVDEDIAKMIRSLYLLLLRYKNKTLSINVIKKQENTLFDTSTLYNILDLPIDRNIGLKSYTTPKMQQPL